MKTDNELIHEFMGHDWRDSEFEWRPGARVPMTIEHLKYYETSWNWIMPVVEKITPIATKIGQQSWFDTKYALIDAHIETVYKRVVQFIKWYNSNKDI